MLSSDIQTKSLIYSLSFSTQLTTNVKFNQQLSEVERLSAKVGTYDDLSSKIRILQYTVSAGGALAGALGGVASEVAQDRVSRGRYDDKVALQAARVALTATLTAIIQETKPSTFRTADEAAAFDYFLHKTIPPQLITAMTDEGKIGFSNISSTVVQESASLARAEGKSAIAESIEAAHIKANEIMADISDLNLEIQSSMADTQSIITSNFDSMTEMTAAQHDEIKDLMGKLGINIGANLAEIKGEMAVEVIPRLKELVAYQREMQAREKKQMVLQAEINKYQGTAKAFGFAKELGAYFGDKTLVKIGVIGESMCSILVANASLGAEGAALGLAALGPLGAIASASFAIFKVLSAQDEVDPNQIIFEMLQQISKDIRELRLEIREQFSETFFRLDQLRILCADNFDHLGFVLNVAVLPQLGSIKTSINELAKFSETAHLESEVGQMLIDMAFVSSLPDVSVNAYKEIKKLGATRYSEYASHMYAYATQISVMRCMNGNVHNTIDSSIDMIGQRFEMLALTSDEMTHAAHVGFLRKNSTLESLDSAECPLPNPLMWSMIMKSYLHFNRCNLDAYQGLVLDVSAEPEKITELLELGQNYLSFVDALKLNAQTIYTHLITKYNDALLAIYTQINSIEKKYDAKIQHDRLEGRPAIPGMKLGTDIVTFAQENYAGYEHLNQEAAKCNFSMSEWENCGAPNPEQHYYDWLVGDSKLCIKLGVFNASGQYPNKPPAKPAQLIKAACDTHPNMAHGLFNLAAAMGAGKYTFKFYTAVSENGAANGRQRFKSKRGHWKCEKGKDHYEQNGLTSSFVIEGRVLPLTRASDQAWLYWQHVDMRDVDPKPKPYDVGPRQITTVTNSHIGDRATDFKGNYTDYSGVSSVDFESVAKTLDADLLSKRKMFKDEVIALLKTLSGDAQAYINQLVVLLKTAGFSGEITRQVISHSGHINELIAMFESFDPTIRALPNYEGLLLGAVSQESQQAVVSEIALRQKLNLVTTPLMQMVEVQMIGLGELANTIANARYCESDDECDAITNLDNSLEGIIVRRPRWEYKRNVVTNGKVDISQHHRPTCAYEGSLSGEENQAEAVVLKSTPLPENYNDQDAKIILREAAIWKGLLDAGAQYVAPLLGLTQHKNKSESKRAITLVAKRAEVDLDSYLSNLFRSGQYLNKKQQILLVLHIAMGLREIHAKGITHGDIKPKNVLLFDPIVDGHNNFFSAKITDFDRVEPGAQGRNDYEGRLYQAPEVQKGKMATQSSDVFSLGIIIWRILSHGQPYVEGANPSDILKDKTSPYFHEGKENPFGFLVAVMNSCAGTDPSLRSTSNSIVKKLLTWEKQDVCALDERHYPGMFSASRQRIPFDAPQQKCGIM